jgi:hypothetical protein
MKNYYLKFENQAQLETVLLANDLAQISPAMNEQPEQFVPKVNLDIIGLIHKPTGNILTTDDSFDYPEMLPINGWHANMKWDLTQDQESALADYLVPQPSTPARVWAGE